MYARRLARGGAISAGVVLLVVLAADAGCVGEDPSINPFADDADGSDSGAQSSSDAGGGASDGDLPVDGPTTEAAAAVPDATVDASLGPHRIIFVTSEVYTGNLGGLGGADAKCDVRAKSVGLTGVYKAWLSDTTATAAARLAHSAYAYRLINGTLVANNWNDLITGNLKHPIDLTEEGTPPPAGDNSCTGLAFTSVWTGSTVDGLICNANSTCVNWTSTAPQPNYGPISDPSLPSGLGCRCGGGLCDHKSALYCLEQ